MCDSPRYLRDHDGHITYNLTESDMSVVVGTYRVLDPEEETQIRHQVQSAVVHKYYSEKPPRYDIMLLRLSTSIQYNDQTSPICVDGTFPWPGERCWVTGWGATDPYGKYSDIDDIDKN